MIVIKRLCAIMLINCAFEFCIGLENEIKDKTRNDLDSKRKPNSNDITMEDFFEIRNIGAILLLKFSFLWFLFCVLSAPSFSSLKKKFPSFIDFFSLLLIGVCFTPVLVTLTSSYANNTVGRLNKLFWILHCYTMSNDESAKWYAFSLNAGFSSIVLLASRLNHIFLSFAFSTLAITLLFINPDDSSNIGKAWQVFISMVACKMYYKNQGVVIFSFFLFFIGVASPLIIDYIAKQPRSVRIRGSWDLLRVVEKHN